MSKQQPNRKLDKQKLPKDRLQGVSDKLDPKVVSSRLTPNPLSEFSMDKDDLRLALVTAQFALRATRQQTPPPANKPTGLLVLVNGMEQAGKGSSVKQLRQWVDPRLLKVEATIGYPPLAYQPIWQAHTKAMPRHGDVMVYFGNWYADLIHNVMRMIQDKSTNGAEVQQKLPTTDWHVYLKEQLAELKTFEQDLSANHTKVLKCWFHIDAETLKERLNDDTADPQYLYQIDWCDEKVLEQFNLIAATILRQQGDWIIIDGNDKSQAQTSFCHEVLHAIQTALASSEKPAKENLDNPAAPDSPDCTAAVFTDTEVPKALTDIKDHDLDKSDYKEKLADKQAEFAKLIRARRGRHVVFAFEGMDAAGKGGSIKRMVAPLDPREYQIYNIGAPMLYELQHPYLWRFWTRLPNEQTDRISRIAIFDRTWYGRVLVERIEGFAEPADWQRAYGEINRFEADLQAAGTLVIKYWLAIDKDEQLKRFEARRETPHKKFKLTDDDWRNRERWQDYVQAAADMLAHTNTEHAPWCIVATNDKRRARLDVLDHAIEQLQASEKWRNKK
ncbi:ATPase [Psychrobacter sp. 1U2]|uniref:ATPase n=1 Tax=Psychrobacter sp. 1U2 TaxID=3453577 RepID=UPI003F46A3F7